MLSFVSSSNIRRKITSVTLTGLSLFTLASCEGDDDVPQRIVIATFPTVTVSPKASTLTVGGTRQLEAVVRDGDGNVINVPVTWSTSDPDVVTVSGSGLVTAVGAGNGSVVASAENGARNSAAFSVLPSAVSSIQIDGPSGLLAVGLARQLVATAFDANGNPIAADFTWSSNNTNLPVNNAGVVIGNAPGTATITATSGSVSRTFTVQSALLTLSMAITPNVTNLAVGSTTQLTATPRDGFGNPIALPVTWTLTSTNSPVTLSPTGSFTIPAGTKGSAVITASVTDDGGTTTLSNIWNPLRHGTPVTGLSGSNSGSNADDFFFYVDVPAGRTSLSFSLSGGSNDPDLYVYRPGSNTSSCNPFLGNGATETCTFTSNITPGIWRIRVEGFSATWAGWTLTTTMAPAP